MPLQRIGLVLDCLIWLLLSGCSNNNAPASYVTGLRVLAIKAEPPDIPAGASSTITALAIDTDGNPIAITWAQCLDPPQSGQLVNPDCITKSSADYLVSVGSGLSVATTMPMINPQMLGRPDASGGVYLPLIAQVAAGADSLTATYQLRLNQGQPPNHNPVLSGIVRVLAAADGGTSDTVVPIDDANPLVVNAGAEITLRATFMDGSAESYQISDPGSMTSRTVTETLSVSWFSTAGSFPAPTFGMDVSETVFDSPAFGGTIDLWAVGRDERGGTDYLHRTLQFQ